MKRLNKKGFTLVELLAVIVVLALLIVVVASTALPAMNNAKKNTLETYTKRVVDQVKGLYANAEIAGAGTLPTGCTKDASGKLTCSYTDIKSIMGADADTTYQIVSGAPITITRTSGNYTVTGKIGGAGFVTEITSASGVISYNTTES